MDKNNDDAAAARSDRESQPIDVPSSASPPNNVVSPSSPSINVPLFSTSDVQYRSPRFFNRNILRLDHRRNEADPPLFPESPSTSDVQYRSPRFFNRNTLRLDHRRNEADPPVYRRVYDSTTDDEDDDDDDADDGNRRRSEAVGMLEPSNRERNLRGGILKYSGAVKRNPTAANVAFQKKKVSSKLLPEMNVNVPEEMHNSINILLDSMKNVKDYEYAFDAIGKYIKDIDYANDFINLGGFVVVIPCLNSKHESVRCKTAELIGVLVRHNQYGQVKFIENPEYINSLIMLVQKDCVDEVRLQSLQAISDLVCDNVPIFWTIAQMGGVDSIVCALKSASDKLKTKAAFLIFSTCLLDNNVADLYVEYGVVEIICSIIMTMKKCLPDDNHLKLLLALEQLIQMSPTKVKEICTKFGDLKNALLSFQNSYPNESDRQDEKDQIFRLMESLTL